MKYVIYVLCSIAIVTIVTLLNLISEGNMLGIGLGNFIMMMIGYGAIGIVLNRNILENNGKEQAK